MFEQLKSAILAVMFFIGYLLAAVTTISITGVTAAVAFTGKQLDIASCHELYRDMIILSQKSIGCFLNYIMSVLPDRVREHLTLEMEYW
jgi:hypothetical protein